MAETIEDRLKEEEQDEMLQELLQDCLRDVRRSRSFMSKLYDDWDVALDTYQQIRDEDAQDIRSKRKKEPTKQTIPLSYAQANTLVTFLTLLYTQNNRFYELNPTGTEDFNLREIAESVLAREIRNNAFTPRLVAFLLDVVRFNLGVFKVSWEEVKVNIPAQAAPISFSTMMGEGGMEEFIKQVNAPQELVVKEGSKVFNISPYNWFPDTRLPMLRWHEGTFMADETGYTIREVKKMDGVYGAEHLNKFDHAMWKERGVTRLEGFDPTKDKDTDKDFMVAVLEMQRRLVPSDYGLSDSDEDEMWLIRIGNDQRILTAEKIEDANLSFTYHYATMAQDLHAKLSECLSSIIEKLQETVTWLINTRVESVKNNLEKQLVIHSNYIELEDLKTRSPFIRMKKNTPIGMGVNTFIQQLKTNDPTVTHIQDAQSLMQVMQMVTGVNENSMGSFHGGRRSATEARNVQAGSSARARLVASCIWEMALAPLGKMLLTNARQWMSEETFYKIVGQPEEDQELVEIYGEFHKENWWELAGSEDFFVFDATTQSEKAFIAQSLQELLIALMSNPEVLMQTNLDPVKIIERIQELRGVTNLKQFTRDEPIQPPIVPGVTQPGATPPPPNAGGAASAIAAV